MCTVHNEDLYLWPVFEVCDKSLLIFSFIAYIGYTIGQKGTSYILW